MNARVFLWVCAVLFLPYGLYCFAMPGALEGIAGVSFTSPTGSAEIRAMYGGLQTAVGALALMGASRPDLARTTVTSIAVLCAGLGLARLSGALLDGGFSMYTAMGLSLEFSLLAVGAWILRGAEPATQPGT